MDFIELDLTPVPAPRQVRSDAWKPRKSVQKYRAFRDEVRYRMKKHPIPEDVEIIEIEFVMPMPKSWSLRKREEQNDAWHRQKPDIDNLVKAFLDSVCMDDDSFIPAIRASKVWGREGKIRVRWE